jgi:acyl carrier protein
MATNTQADQRAALQWVQMGFAKQVLASILGDDPRDRMDRHAGLVDDLGADSLDLVELESALEDLGIVLPDGSYAHLLRVGDIADLFTPEAAEKAGRCICCDGAGEHIINRHPSRGPLYEDGYRCAKCDGTGRANARSAIPVDPDMLPGGHDNMREAA